MGGRSDSKIRPKRPGIYILPTALQFTEEFDSQHYISSAWRSAATLKPLSLYFHIPFCQHICYYCACNKMVTSHKDQTEQYLQYLFREIELQADLYNKEQKVLQLHLGGGTPAYLSAEQITALMNKVRQHFRLSRGVAIDYSIELDPGEVDWPLMGTLRDLGFTHISLDIQDLDPGVQKAVSRVATEEQIVSVLDAARTMLFKSVHMNLVYGLPLQTVSRFLDTIERVIDMQPDRLSLFNYAHLSHRCMPQRHINESDLPGPDTKLRILQMATRTLLDSGYVYIGMDQFALPDDELTIARENGTLHRNFQGYTTRSECDLVGMGTSSISKAGDTYARNHVDMVAYQEAIDSNQLPVRRGLVMTDDDQIRQTVINELICHFQLAPQAVEQQFDIDFPNYFNSELITLQSMEKDGLLTVDNKLIKVSPTGKFLIRHICKVFDPFFRPEANL